MTEKQRTSKQGNAIVTFWVTFVKKCDVELEHFLTKSTDFSGEPNNADGTIISMKVREFSPISKGEKEYTKTVDNDKKVKKALNAPDDELDQFMHFSFHGAKFCIDRKNMIVQCDQKPKVSEATGEVKSGLYGINVETSN